MNPEMSVHFRNRLPSPIRQAQIKFAERTDNTAAVNTAIGNVSLPAHPAMQKRMYNLDKPESPFSTGTIKYSATVGIKETNDAFLNIIASSGFKTDQLYSQITNGGSQAMELIVIGTCGPAGSGEKPLLLIDAAYTNYNAMISRLGRRSVSVTRKLQKNGKFILPEPDEIEECIIRENPGALLMIPYDNPTGHFYDKDIMIKLAELCVRHNMWFISDEAYRELLYLDKPVSSIWGISNDLVPGIEGRRISIETSSKVWNACGLRIGALVTDNKEYHQKSVAENTADLCANVIGQYIFGALAHENHNDLKAWYAAQRKYYYSMLHQLSEEMKKRIPGIIVSSPDASIYSVVDVRNAADKDFNAADFVIYCAGEGKVSIDGKDWTLLVSPMSGFYTVQNKADNPGTTQMRIAYVESPEKMKMVPMLFEKLLKAYQAERQA